MHEHTAKVRYFYTGEALGCEFHITGLEECQCGAIRECIQFSPGPHKPGEGTWAEWQQPDRYYFD